MKLDGKVQNASKTSLKFGGEETSLIVHISLPSFISHISKTEPFILKVT